MAKPLVIVESPAKARTIDKILGPDFIVGSSVGHVRDLPATAADIPASYKGERWARLGVDVDNDFKPLYVVPPEKKQQVTKLKQLLKDASELYVATDEDREGESIAWHLLEVLSPRVPVKRMVFHEITPDAVKRAVENPRDLDRRLVDAQEARRILDRLYGYEVSPVLWKKVLPKLSAGRVQSVATRIIVERERERMRFRAASYWDIEGFFRPESPPEASFGARLVSVDGRRVATGKDFNERGELKRSGVIALAEERASALATSLRDASFSVRNVEEKPYRASPYPPFITASLQQEAARKLNFTSQKTMQVAQRLYENGYITYMRTDSVVLSETALQAARGLIKRLYGPDYLPDKPRRYKSKVRNAQEAHEAIRPAGDDFRRPEDVAREVSGDEARLYELIWKRTVASQMADAHGRSVHIRLGAISSAGEDAEFGASGKTIVFPGFLRAYVEGADDADAELEDREVRLPVLSKGQPLVATDLRPQPHSTQPPSRYTEASLVKKLEELGVGRPSTYASIISTIQQRGYVFKKGNALIPSWTAFAAVALLEKHFSRLVDYDFTAEMEDDLDEIAAGDEEAIPWLRRFYFGDGQAGLRTMVSVDVDRIDAREINSFLIGKDGEGREVVVRVGRYGPYLEREGERVSLPEDLPPEELTIERAAELLAAPSGDRVLGAHPETGLPVIVKAGRYGPYVQLGEADGESRAKPRTVSLLKSMDPQSVTMEEALRLLSLPRVVGTDPADGQQITAQTGRYGPYLKKGNETRSLEHEEQVFSVDLEEALRLFSESGKGRARSSAVRELGPDPDTGRSVVLRLGRYGPYVTDGETNASIPSDESPDSITLGRAATLLAEKRASPGGKRRSRRKK